MSFLPRLFRGGHRNGQRPQGENADLPPLGADGPRTGRLSPEGRRSQVTPEFGGANLGDSFQQRGL